MKTSRFILDVTHPGDGSTSRHILSHLPVTLGRAFDNDIILDDPFVDPHHAVIEAGAETGNPVLRDLHSKNGILDHHHVRRNLPLTSGHPFALGRTECRYYAATHHLPSTLKLEKQHSWQSKMQQPLIVWPLYFATIAVIAGWSYLNIWSDETSSALATAGVVTGSAILIWAGIWAVIGRLVRRRAQFAGHIAVACIYILASCLVWILQSYVNFLSNENWVAQIFDHAVSFIVLAALVSATLSLATTMLARRRKGAAMISAAGILFGSLAFSLISAKTFDAEPHYAGEIEPYLSSWAPAKTPEKLMESNQKLFKSKAFEHNKAKKG